jgi:hypothetical protein
VRGWFLVCYFYSCIALATWFAWYIRYISFCTGGMGDVSLVVDDTPVNIISLCLEDCYVVVIYDVVDLLTGNALWIYGELAGRVLGSYKSE